MEIVVAVLIVALLLWRPAHGGFYVRVMSPKTSETLDKLNRLAYGNTRLVDQALRKARRQNSSSVDLKDVVEYILDRRNSPPARSS